jgi:hypothetical protein
MTLPKLATTLPLLHSDDATLRSQAVITLGQLGDEQAIAALCQTLLNDSNLEFAATQQMPSANSPALKLRSPIKPINKIPPHSIRLSSHKSQTQQT